MKRLIFVSVITFVGLNLYAQTNTFPSSGNVGIGTTSPSVELEVKSTSGSNSEIHINTTSDGGLSILRFQDAGTATWGFLSNYPQSDKFSLHNYQTGSQAIVLNSSSYMGIGTTNPVSLLDVNGDIAIKFGNVLRVNVPDGNSGNWTTTSNRTILKTGWQSGLGDFVDFKVPGALDNTAVIRFTNQGRFGIGTSSPSAELEVKSNGNTDAEIHINATANGDQSIIRFQDAGQSTWGFLSNYPGTGTFSLYNYMTNNNTMVFNSSNQVGIGTTSMGTHKLAVEGSIGAREIKVEATGWSDFVFENDYKLRTLEEVEQHIKENGHLPEIPSEEEIIENGINLGEMDAKILQKVEELTLYVIDMNKRVNELETENEELKEEISTLKNK